MSILEEIFAHKRARVAAARQILPEAELQKQAGLAPVPPDFVRALKRSPAPVLIAEVKKRSPSRGLLCDDFDPLRLAKTYAQNGAAAISVLTDQHYFGGSLDHLRQIASSGLTTPGFPEKDQKFPLPLLRKDFIFDHYQLLEARAAGASAILLITALLGPFRLASLVQAAYELDLAPLVEVHSRPELERALGVGADLIGINNRDLHTFRVDLRTTLDLRPQIPPGITVVSESGIKSQEDVQQLEQAGVDAMLIGEGIVTAEDRAARVRELSRFAGLRIRV